MQNIETFKSFLQSPKKIVILPHRRPDADALGSSLAFSQFLGKCGHDAVIISPDNYPDFLNWLPGNEKVLIHENGHKAQAEQLIKDADLIACLDFNDLDRIEKLGDLVKKANGKKLLIDHHLGKADFADFEKWDPKAAATAELVYDLILQLGEKDKIDLSIAESIYAGIITDTGSFKYSSTSSKLHRSVADLIDLGLDTERIHRLIYDTNTENRIKFLGYALDKKLVVLKEFKTAFIAISADELKKFHAKTGDTEGFVNYALSIEGIRLAALFIDRTEQISMSFRSVGDFAVNELASKYFSGGGHKNASGGRSDETLDEVVKRFRSILPEYKKKLNS